MIARIICCAGLSAYMLGCTPTHLSVLGPPAETTQRVASRLAEEGVALDPSAPGPHRLRSAILCFVPHDYHGLGWKRSLSRIGPGLKPVEVIGADAVQRRSKETCPHQFRFTVFSEKSPSGTRLTVQSEWWAIKAQACTPHGNPAMAEMKCTYRYQGTSAQADIIGHVYGLLDGV